MSKSNYIISMIHSFSTKDYEGFVKDCYDLIKFEETKGNFKIAMKMREALEKPSPKSSKIAPNSLTLEPINKFQTNKSILNFSSKNDDDDNFFELRKSTIKLNEVILGDNVLDSISNIISQWKNKEKLAKFNLVPQSKVLFYGLPGTGKTFTAYAIANELNLEVVYINFDSVVSSFLGKTGSNLGKIFKFANSRPCLLLIDELDAIGKMRDDSRELGELKRIVISLLQNLDNLSAQSLVIACTNHEKLLDKALWRRFDGIIEFKLPSQKERITVIENTLIKSKIKLDNGWIKSIGEITENFSPANIIKGVENGIRRWVIEANKEIRVYPLIVEEILKLLDLEGLSLQKKVEISRKLRDESRIFTLAYLSNIMDIPKSTLHKKLKGDVEHNE
ncbi:ATP-binding protein [Bacillus anthracis]|uniref:AAA family ATPase n=1 Tax=Bacillus anthracis TaxID=1392 RepID=UPI003D1DF13D